MARSKIVRLGNGEVEAPKNATGRAAVPKQKKRGIQRAGEISAKSQVYASVKQQVLNGQHPAGAWLPIDDLAAEFGVSRQPVMDAIKRLTIEGFIEIVPQVGSRIRQYSTEDVNDFFDFFALSESHIARTAAHRADADDILDLRLISAQLNVLPRVKKSSVEIVKLYRSLNRQLHTRLSESVKSPMLGELVEGLRDRADFFITTYSAVDNRLNDALNEHDAIIDAIEQGNAEEAGSLMHAHVLAFKPRLS